jgi:hypothetical protein
VTVGRRSRRGAGHGLVASFARRLVVRAVKQPAEQVGGVGHHDRDRLTERDVLIRLGKQLRASASR